VDPRTPNGDGDEHDDGIDVGALLDVAATQITDQARRHPVRTLGIAFGVGYVLGGGLPRFAVRLAAGALVRTAGTAVLGALPWGRIAETFVAYGAGERDAAAKPSNGHSRAQDRR
jgi:hypothetical protein